LQDLQDEERNPSYPTIWKSGPYLTTDILENCRGHSLSAGRGIIGPWPLHDKHTGKPVRRK